ncbi:heavy metal efflux protein [Anopheles sinensis]|uniref:Heavy metal efflux protein n=1 Tax=Anopheles sinensis TaxID=74873 RepID=A0A084VW86_ANOSI|nr:heavy metal efflux protein [Anopheles sinensis]
MFKYSTRRHFLQREAANAASGGSDFEHRLTDRYFQQETTTFCRKREPPGTGWVVIPAAGGREKPDRRGADCPPGVLEAVTIAPQPPPDRELRPGHPTERLDEHQHPPGPGAGGAGGGGGGSPLSVSPITSYLRRAAAAAVPRRRTKAKVRYGPLLPILALNSATPSSSCTSEIRGDYRVSAACARGVRVCVWVGVLRLLRLDHKTVLGVTHQNFLHL